MNNRFATLAPSVVRAAIGAAALTVGASGIAGAQTAPNRPTPTYATPSGDEQIRGHISAITGKYSIQVRDNRGYLDNVTLHQGTVINPTGLALAPGMQVTISGLNAGATFAANEINTPYTVALVQPYYGGYGYGGYGFGGFGGYGPGFGFGGFGPFYRGGFFW